MTLRNCLLALALMCGLTVFSSEAQAGKGVKKKSATGHHTHHGVVTHVEHHKNGTGSVTIKTHSHKKKKTATATAKSAKPTKASHGHTFTVNQSTQVSIAHGKNHKPSSFKAVHKGEHVALVASKHHAEKIVIHAHQKSGKKTKTPAKKVK